ncbi:MAG: efflux RND transporter permease subunit [Acidobacteria bacterium]|nr:MAG: efflux RND transporter permease subunit [Acidobacteriota bacterium]
MTALTRAALRRPLTIYMLMALSVIGGLAAYRALPRESFPEIRIPLIVVSTVYPGSSPSDVEAQVTRKIETELKGLSGVKEIRSTSSDGYSLIEVEFTPDVELDTALQKVRERVDLALPELPEDAEDPAISDIDFSRIPIMILHLGGDLGMVRLKRIADDLEDRLEAIPGVNQVNVIGGQEREVHVFADPRRLTAYGIGLSDLIETIEREHLSVPGGSLDIGRLSFLVRVPAEVQDPLEIADFVVEVVGGRPVYVKDVADVVYGFEEESSRARLNGSPAIALTVEKRTGANIIAVARSIREVAEDVRRQLPSGAELRITEDQSEDIEEMVRNLENNILSGLVLVLVVLFLAMGWRPAVIVAAAIPFSMVITFLAVALLGYTLNMVILFSLVLLLGMLVDNAIVTVENIYRHREAGDPPAVAAEAGTREVTMPIVASTATTLSAFAPMLMWPGIVGEFMKFLPVTLILGLSASLLVALVFNPTLALRLLSVPPRGPARHGRGRWLDRYEKLLRWCLDRGPEVPLGFTRNWLLLVVFFAALALALAAGLAGSLAGVPVPASLPAGLLGAAAAAFAAQGVLWLLSLPAVLAGRRAWITDHRARILWSMGALLALTLAAYGALGRGVEFFPEIEPRTIWIDMEFPPGTTLDAQDALVSVIEERTRDVPDLVAAMANVGSTGVSAQGGPVGGRASNRSRVTLELERFQARSRSSFLTLQEVRREVADLTGAQINVVKPDDGPPTGKPVAIRLIGDDYAALGRAAEELRRRLAREPGLLNVSEDYDEGFPEVRVEIDREAAARSGTNTRDVALAIRTALAGTEVAKFRSGEDEYDIVVRLPAPERRSLDTLEELTVVGAGGRTVPIRSLARVVAASGPSAIRRVDLHRVITVEADVDHAGGYTDGEMRRRAAAAVAGLGLPDGVRWEFAGSTEEEGESRDFLVRAFLVAILLIALILVTEFDSLVTPITILVSVVLSLIGVLWGLIVTRTPFGIVMTGIGVISLAGIVVNNAIVLCDFILQARRRGVGKVEAIVAAGRTRMRPVLLTAVTTVLGLIPLTTGVNVDFFGGGVTFGSESSQWWGPMGVAVIFGLGVATALTLVVVPVTYDVLSDVSER